MYIVYDPNHNIKLLTDDPDSVITSIKAQLPDGENVGINEKYPNTLFTIRGVYVVSVLEVDKWIV